MRSAWLVGALAGLVVIGSAGEAAADEQTGVAWKLEVSSELGSGGATPDSIERDILLPRLVAAVWKCTVGAPRWLRQADGSVSELRDLFCRHAGGATVATQGGCLVGERNVHGSSLSLYVSPTPGALMPMTMIILTCAARP